MLCSGKFEHRFRALVVLLVIVLAGVPTAQAQTAVRRAASPRQQTPAAVQTLRSGLRRPAAITRCLGFGVDSFIGNPSVVAAGQAAGVLAGAVNDACDTDSGIVAGNDNIIGIGGAFSVGIGGAFSVIGGGFSNGMGGSTSFIGAGAANTLGGGGSLTQNAFIGAGSGNVVTGNGSFLGAGGSLGLSNPNIVSGRDAFELATPTR